MHRRQFLYLLSSTSVIALTGAMPALAQKGPARPAAVPPVGSGNVEIDLPNQWKNRGLADGLPPRGGGGGSSPTVGNGGSGSATGGGEFVSPNTTAPTGRSMPISQSLVDTQTVQSADLGLNLSVINDTYNPFRSDALVGPFKAPGELFLGKAFVPVKDIIEGTIKATSGGSVPAPLKPLIAALSKEAVLKTPAHQFKLDSGLGNRVVFYEAEGNNKIGHKHLDRVIDDFNVNGRARLLKLMNYLHLGGSQTGGQGGRPGDIVGGGGQAGTHHVGGFSLGYRKADGSGSMTLRSEWPDNYSRLDDPAKEDHHVNYNPHLIAIDYRGGTRDEIPSETVAAYNRNADLWDCCAGMVVPFASGDLDPNYRQYEYNPLEITDQTSALSVAQDLAQFDQKSFLIKHGAFYCAEGQFVVANLGPQEDTLLKKSKYGSTPFGQRIENFRNAPKFSGMSEQQRRRNPKIGWDHLKSLGVERGGISDQQYAALTETRRFNTSLEWIPENIRGWQAYRPRQVDGLIARPMTVATMAWGIFRNYLPADGIARTIVTDVMRAHNAGNAAVKAAVTAMCQGNSPTAPAGQAILSGIALKAAVGFQLGVLGQKEVREKLLEQAGYKEIKSAADQGKVQAAYDEFLGILKAADFTSKASVDKALWEADVRLSQLKVERTHYNKVTRQTHVVKEALMRYAAPVCVLFWTQHPFLAETECLRYVATAMHTKQAKTRPT